MDFNYEPEGIAHLHKCASDPSTLAEHMAGFSRASSFTRPGYSNERYLSNDYRSIFEAISDMMACEYHEPGTRGEWAPWTDPPAHALNPRAIRVSAAVRQAAGSEASAKGGPVGAVGGDGVISTIDTTSNKASAAGGGNA